MGTGAGDGVYTQGEEEDNGENDDFESRVSLNRRHLQNRRMAIRIGLVRSDT